MEGKDRRDWEQQAAGKGGERQHRERAAQGKASASSRPHLRTPPAQRAASAACTACTAPAAAAHLQGDLHGVHAQLRVQPLLGGLEDQGQGDEVGHVELLQGLHGLGGVLAGGAAHQGKAGEGDHAVDVGLAGAQGVVEELLDGGGEVQAACSAGGGPVRAVREGAGQGSAGSRRSAGWLSGGDDSGGSGLPAPAARVPLHPTTGSSSTSTHPRRRGRPLRRATQAPTPRRRSGRGPR